MKSIPLAADYIKDFEQLGFGMFVHYGLFSILESGEWSFSIHKRNMDEYSKLIDNFNTKADAIKNIVAIAKNAGCKYITLTARHHEGFSLYDTKGLNDFDVMHSPTARDLVKEFVNECNKEGIIPFLYHTTLDWYVKEFNQDFNAYLKYLQKSIELLCTNYGKIGGFWFDGNWSKPEADWKENELYGMIRTLQPKTMIINNTGVNKRGETGADEIDSVTYERGMPTPIDRRGMKKYVAGEMCETLCDHWGAADDVNYKSVKQIIEELCECRKVGANFLLNIAPNADGSVNKIQEGIMERIGHWMGLFGKAIYNGRPYTSYLNNKDFILKDEKNKKTFYLFKFNLKASYGDQNVTIDFNDDKISEFPQFNAGEIEKISWMDNNEELRFTQENDLLKVFCTGFNYGKAYCVRVAEIKLK